MFTIFSIFSILSGGCAVNPSRGYLFKVTPAPLLEKEFSYNSDKSSLEIIVDLSEAMTKLKKEQISLKQQLKKSQTNFVQHTNESQDLQTKLQTLETQHTKAAEQLTMAKELSKSQEKEILKITIEKVRLEQELVKLKIDMLNKKEGVKQ